MGSTVLLNSARRIATVRVQVSAATANKLLDSLSASTKSTAKPLPFYTTNPPLQTKSTPQNFSKTPFGDIQKPTIILTSRFYSTDSGDKDTAKPITLSETERKNSGFIETQKFKDLYTLLVKSGVSGGAIKEGILDADNWEVILVPGDDDSLPPKAAALFSVSPLNEEYKPDPNGEYKSLAIAVQEDARRQGLGEKTKVAAFELLRDLGVDKVSISVESKNRASCLLQFQTGEKYFPVTCFDENGNEVSKEECLEICKRNARKQEPPYFTFVFNLQNDEA